MGPKTTPNSPANKMTGTGHHRETIPVTRGLGLLSPVVSALTPCGGEGLEFVFNHMANDSITCASIMKA